VTDNLFERLAELLQSSGPVNWRLGREIAESVAGQAEPIEPWLAEEYEELANAAALRMAAASTLDVAPAGVRILDPRTWASETVDAFAYLAEPIAERLGGADAGPLGGALPLGSALMGLQMGTMTGFMAQRVLGEFDIGIPTGEDRGAVFVVANVEAFAETHGLDRRQTRLWVAMHEIAHDAVLSLPWTREHFLMLVHEFVEGLEPDRDGLMGRMDLLQDPEELQRLLDDPGKAPGLFVNEGGTDAVDRMQAFMAVVEGYGDRMIDTAAAGLVPEAERIRAALDERRSEPSGSEQMLGSLIGLELHQAEYGKGAAFCAEVERRWGSEALERLWEGPEMLPTAAELDDPVGWAARVLL
jgi:putative hydrolase